MGVAKGLTQQELDLSIEAAQVVGGPLLQGRQRRWIQTEQEGLAGHQRSYW
jgi:hypothetical protein